MSSPFTADHADLATVVGYPVRIVAKALACGSRARGWAREERIATTNSIMALASVGKLGLAGMEERARLVGGKLTLESEPGEGTTVTVEVPV